MTWQKSTLGPFCDWLVDELRKLNVLEKVTVHPAPVVSPSEDGRVATLQIVEVALDQDWAAVGALEREESYVVRMHAYAAEPGIGQASIISRDRVMGMFQAVDDLLRDNATRRPSFGADYGQLVGLQAGRLRLVMGAGARVRWALIEFDVIVDAVLQEA